MSSDSILDRIESEAKKALLTNAIFRWESAVVIGGTVLLSVFFNRPFPGWPIWAWPAIGLVSEIAVIISSLTDKAELQKVMESLFREKYSTAGIRDRDLRAKLGEAEQYRQRIQQVVGQQRSGVLRDRLVSTTAEVYDWATKQRHAAQTAHARHAAQLCLPTSASLVRTRSRCRSCDCRPLDVSGPRQGYGHVLVPHRDGPVALDCRRAFRTIRREKTMKKAHLQSHRDLLGPAPTVLLPVSHCSAQPQPTNSQRLPRYVQVADSVPGARTPHEGRDFVCGRPGRSMYPEVSQDLERRRGNGPRSRNARLAAIRSFIRYAASAEPLLLPVAQCLLAIPVKRFERPFVGYLTKEQIQSMLDAPNTSSPRACVTLFF